MEMAMVVINEPESMIKNIMAVIISLRGLFSIISHNFVIYNIEQW